MGLLFFQSCSQSFMLTHTMPPHFWVPDSCWWHATIRPQLKFPIDPLNVMHYSGSTLGRFHPQSYSYVSCGTVVLTITEPYNSEVQWLGVCSEPNTLCVNHYLNPGQGKLIILPSNLLRCWWSFDQFQSCMALEPSYQLLEHGILPVLWFFCCAYMKLHCFI